ncbi:uncharacterized protein LOC113237866 [Hyposmocoma kahamanoa]|uniref:uncharacterized protein LOC113237866 n=1 Tax=Hyposmocoma kahamanoa TaxID=1477025 RepID=UPI000E6D823E|nr:uncharacterized protein LOC113237866 [Hyposmocoma kahamanoa]
MLGRGVITFFVLAAVSASLNAQRIETWVDVDTETEGPEVEKRYTPELLEELQNAKNTIMLMYTEFTARAAVDLKIFKRNISALTPDTMKSLGWGLLQSAPESCRTQFDTRLKKIKDDSHLSAMFSSVNHNKFFKGHMIVFHMHLNKSENYIRKCETVIKRCGIACETTPKVARWRNLAKVELNRVLSDIPISRRSYKDLLVHAHRKLTKLRNDAHRKASEVVKQLEECAGLANTT